MKKWLTACLCLLLLPQLCPAQSARLLTPREGLSSSLILCLFQDSTGDIWIGTENGLNRYDGVKISAYNFSLSAPHALDHSIVRVVCEDSRGHLLVGTQGGVQLYDRSSDRFSEPLRMSDGAAFYGNVNDIIECPDGRVLVSGNRLFEVDFSGAIPQLVPTDYPLPEYSSGELSDDGQGGLWVARFAEGLYHMSPDGKVSHFGQDIFNASYLTICSVGNRLIAANGTGSIFCHDIATDRFTRHDGLPFSGSMIDVLYPLGEGRILVGTDDRGAFILNTDDFSAERLSVSGIPFDPYRMKVHDAIRDRNGNLWLGIYQKGVMMVPRQSSNFGYMGSLSSDADIIGSCCVTSLLIDREDNLWVGTDNDGIYLLGPERTPLHHYSIADGLPGTTFSLTQDAEGRIWFGTFTKGLWSIDPRSGKVVQIRSLPGGDSPDSSIYALEEDDSRRLWIGSMGEGLFWYDLHARRLVRPAPDVLQDMNPWILDLEIGGDGLLYAATYDGMFGLDISGAQPVIKKHLFPGFIIYSLRADGSDLYIGTAGGLVIMSLPDGEFVPFRSEDGLADDSVCDFQVTDGQGIWISTHEGLSRFERPGGKFVNFYSEDGLQVREYSRNTSAQDSRGRLYFGGTEGVTWFDPSEISETSRIWHTRIVGFSVPDRFVPINPDNTYVLSAQENSCTVEFTTAEYHAPEGVIFKYTTDGTHWNTLTRGQSSVTLSNLKPGRFRLSVKACDAGVESEPTTVSIRVRSFWWWSTPAKAAYLLLLFLLLYFILRLYQKQVRDRREIERHEQLEKANEEKVQFFMNISHEIRSPMTLIVAPLQKLIGSDPDPDRQRSYAIMNRNAGLILQLVNQMLDIRKIEKAQMRMSFSPVNIVDYVAPICSLFQQQAEQKGVTLAFRYSGPKETEVWLDRAHFNKVIMNLLSNAVKFTPEGGRITVTVASEARDVRIDVRDTGVGMSRETLENAFKRFYQGDRSIAGTGIGLNLAQMLVNLHHGTISAANNADGPGSTFSVTLPLGNAHLSDEEMQVPPAPATDNAAPDVPPPADPLPEAQGAGRKRRTILLAEDNSDIRQYLHSEFSGDYRIIECADGKQAYNQILQATPDLIISDVIMPEMDGFTLCKKIRKNPKINHLPIILLTAKTLEQDRIDSLDAGADAYIAKPFNIDVLRKSVDSLLSSRDRLKVSFSEAKVTNADIKDVNIKTPDDRLMDRVLRVVNEHLDDPELTVDYVAREVGLSRVHLYRKIKELTNQTSHDFIRNVRLNKAAEMLAQGKYSIAELADAVGFSNPSAFATAFKDLFGVTPSEYRASR